MLKPVPFLLPQKLCSQQWQKEDRDFFFFFDGTKTMNEVSICEVLANTKPRPFQDEGWLSVGVVLVFNVVW